MIFNIYAHIVSKIACRHFVLCKVASKTKHFQSHAGILVLVSEFLVVVILSEWWLVPTTANHCGHIHEETQFHVHTIAT